jgi:hypothetical protein
MVWMTLPADTAFHGVEELDEFLVGMLWHAAPDHSGARHRLHRNGASAGDA